MSFRLQVLITILLKQAMHSQKQDHILKERPLKLEVEGDSYSQSKINKHKFEDQ